MPHVTFIHGIGNKPPTDALLNLWLDALGDGDDPLPLAALGVTSGMVYWADVLHAAPDTDIAAYKSVDEDGRSRLDGADEVDDFVPAGGEGAAFVARLRATLGGTSEDEREMPDAGPETEGIGLKRVPLPWFLKRRILRTFLRDVHHYLFDVEFSPRPGATYRVQQEIRARVAAAVDSRSVTPPHVVVSHSMGTVIAYDCLKRVAAVGAVDGLVTLGSPLGLDEIQDRLTPGWTREDGFPSERVRLGWTNGFDGLDVVCGLDPRLADDYRRAGSDVVVDVSVRNDGAWRHSIGKYLRQSAVRLALRQALGV